MRADAPGKLVISGAYAVLRGAPAIVTAVNRRVVSDTKLPATYLAPEVESGLALLPTQHPHPFYDAGELRSAEDKLGLGSSAAICVACLGALLAEDSPTSSLLGLRENLYTLAREAHRIAQGGGSGIDIAAACFGGTLLAQLDPHVPDAPPRVESLGLPDDMVIEVWGASNSASTAEFVKRVLSLEASEPDTFQRTFERQRNASEAAVAALRASNTSTFIESLIEQRKALRALGRCAGLPIVPDEVDSLAEELGPKGALLPSGAGGGDVNLFVGTAPSSAKFREHAIDRGLFRVPLAVGSEGFRLLSEN